MTNDKERDQLIGLRVNQDRVVESWIKLIVDGRSGTDSHSRLYSQAIDVNRNHRPAVARGDWFHRPILRDGVRRCYWAHRWVGAQMGALVDSEIQ